MVLPDKKTGIVCEEENEKGVLRVQMPGKKIYINHKRVRLQVAASQLYPEDYGADGSSIWQEVPHTGENAVVYTEDTTSAMVSPA